MKGIVLQPADEHPLKTSLVYPPDFFDRLSHLLPGLKTDELIKKTSENIVSCGIRVYRIIREIQGQLRPITNKDLREVSSVLLKALLRGNDLPEASKEFKAKLPMFSFKIEMLLSKDAAFSRQIALGRLVKPSHRPPDIALNVLIIYLREHLKAKQYRPNNALICEFLSEQGIKEGFEPYRISKLAAKINPTKLKEIYEFFQEVYESPGIWSDSLNSLLGFLHETNRVAVDKPSELRDLSLFPLWDEFMP